MPKYIPSDDLEMRWAFSSEDDDPEDVSGSITDALECILKDAGNSDYEWACGLLGADCSSTCVRIRTFFEGVANIDMHQNNWMWNADGEIIITDPVSFSKCSSS